ncbi:MAG: DUF2851 family protein [Kiritimatiellae bacterium]|nr:DUF2851 family protein [Kiritimatiellia bacterium]
MNRFGGIALNLADWYSGILTGFFGSSCGERQGAYVANFFWTERHLQCVWFDSRYRPSVFRLANGETVTVLSPGEWNLEAGPDFFNARLLVQPGNRQLFGDVEVHIRPSDWTLHGHGSDPAYRNVVAHVTWTGGVQPSTLPSGAVSLSLCEPLMSRPGFSLGDIDVKAYPHQVLPEAPCPCSRLLARDPDLAVRLLTAAGQYRLRVKALRIAQRLETLGDRYQVFYEEIMAALGYKHNQEPFRDLSRRLPYAVISGLCREDAEARLLGLSGLLPQPDCAPDDAGHRELLALWNRWWRVAGEYEPEPLPTWSLGGIRPQNSPVRRMAAAACLFTGRPALLDSIDVVSMEPGRRWQSQAADCFTRRCRWPFWNNRLTFASSPGEQDITLLGDSRAAAMLTNIVLPLALAEGRWPEDQTLRRLPAEDLSAPMKQAAWYLFGRDHNPALYADNGLLQQGLLQVYLDFCLNAQPGCAGCRLAAALEKGKETV